MNNQIRSFIAVDLAETSIKEHITKLQADLQQIGADLKLVDPSIMHLTLRFLGEIPEQTVDKVKEVLSKIRFAEFQATFKGVGAFPNTNRINVIWVGILNGQDQLSEISKQIEPNLRGIGLAPDNKGFSPHLTIARVKSGRNRAALTEIVTRMSDVEFGSMAVKFVRLKKSTLTPKGPIYTTLHEVQAT